MKTMMIARMMLCVLLSVQGAVVVGQLDIDELESVTKQDLLLRKLKKASGSSGKKATASPTVSPMPTDEPTTAPPTDEPTTAPPTVSLAPSFGKKGAKAPKSSKTTGPTTTKSAKSSKNRRRRAEVKKRRRRAEASPQQEETLDSVDEENMDEEEMLDSEEEESMDEETLDSDKEELTNPELAAEAVAVL